MNQNNNLVYSNDINNEIPNISYGYPNMYPQNPVVYRPRRKRPRFLHLSYYLSFFIPSRQHYCNKCNFYMEHRFTSRWKNNIRPGSSCAPSCGGMAM